MSLLVLIFCAVVLARRRRSRTSTAVPVVIGALALAGTLHSCVGCVRMFEAVSVVNPQDKATILAAGISEAINASAFGLIVFGPILVAAYFLDRWLRRRAAANATQTAP